jgi:hypothetical protein
MVPSNAHIYVPDRRSRPKARVSSGQLTAQIEVLRRRFGSTAPGPASRCRASGRAEAAGYQINAAGRLNRLDSVSRPAAAESSGSLVGVPGRCVMTTYGHAYRSG